MTGHKKYIQFSGKMVQSPLLKGNCCHGKPAIDTLESIYINEENICRF